MGIIPTWFALFLKGDYYMGTRNCFMQKGYAYRAPGFGQGTVVLGGVLVEGLECDVQLSRPVKLGKVGDDMLRGFDGLREGFLKI